MMSTCYKGAGIGSFWHKNDPLARGSSFVAPFAGTRQSPTAVINHILFQQVAYSPYISLTRSFEVAETYARYNSIRVPSAGDPSFVYLLDIDDKSGATLVDPVKSIAESFGTPFAGNFYQHDGAQDVILGLIDRPNFGHVLTRLVRTPAGTIGRAANISNELHTIVLALRDAEILAYDVIPRNCILRRFDIL